MIAKNLPIVIFILLIINPISSWAATDKESNEKPLIDKMAETVVFINALKRETVTDANGLVTKYGEIKSEGGTAFLVKHKGKLGDIL